MSSVENNQTALEANGKGAGVHDIAIELLTPDPFQPRLEFKDSAIQELANSIQLHGVLTPLLVRPMQGPGSRGRFWIVAGERRYRAAQRLGLETLPCRIREYENTTAAVVALAENVHRQDLSELEKAEALLRIKTLTERTWEQISELVKLSPDYVKRLVGLLKLSDPVKELLRDGRISARVAIALKPLPAKQQQRMAERALAEGLTAEQIRDEAQGSRGSSPRRSAPEPKLDRVQQLSNPEAAQREGSVVRVLMDCGNAVAEMEEWISARRWTRTATSEKQRAALTRLSQQVNLLQQELAQINHALREEEEEPADQHWPTNAVQF